MAKHQDSNAQPGKPYPQQSEIVYMTLYTIANVMFFILSWWICSCFKSVAEVIKVGGHGWECKNYRAVKEDRANRAANRSSQKASLRNAAEEEDDLA